MAESHKFAIRSVLLMLLACCAAAPTFALTPAVLATGALATGALATGALAQDGDELDVLLHNLVAFAEDGAQPQAQATWRELVRTCGAEDLTLVLGAMNDRAISSELKGTASRAPLTENWLRAAADAIAERELAETGTLPKKQLEEFALDNSQSPRARRVAYEWLVKVNADAPTRLLPKMLDDSSLELRYDAVAQLIDEAKDATDENDKLQKYQRALRSARDRGQLSACAEALKELGQTPNMAEQAGFVTHWKVIGPFDNSKRAGFDKVYPPEQSVDLDAKVAGKDGPLEWKDAVAEQEDLEKIGLVDLNKALVEEKNVLAYAVTTFVSKEDQKVECRYESKEATKLWVNGEEIAAENVYHSGGGFDQYIVPCQLMAGPNQILIKVCQNEQTEPWTKPWDFRLRITDSLGGAIRSAK